MWGEGRNYFKSEGPNILAQSQVNSPKILPPPKMCAQKIVTLPCNNILRIQMLHRENPYERNFETITWENRFSVIVTYHQLSVHFWSRLVLRGAFTKLSAIQMYYDHRKITWRWRWLNNKAKLKPCAVFKAISKSSKLEAIPREVTAHLQPIRVLFNRAVQLWVCNSVNITCRSIVSQAVLNISVAQNPFNSEKQSKGLIGLQDS